MEDETEIYYQHTLCTKRIQKLFLLGLFPNAPRNREDGACYNDRRMYRNNRLIYLIKYHDSQSAIDKER